MSEAWRRRGLYVAGATGKVAYFGACLALYVSGRATRALLAFGILDVMFAAFFVDVVWLQRTERQREAQRLVTA